jgi:DNA-binding transcriptional ArsR family regulator
MATPPVNANDHPRHSLDEIIHAPVRLSIMAILNDTERADFRFLRDALGVSDSLLSRHLTTLDTAGYVNIMKGGSGRRPRTWLALSQAGRRAYAAYLASLRSIVGSGLAHPGTEDGSGDD